MFRKKKFKDLTLKYDKHLYSGIQGYLMKLCHEDLEKYNFSKKIPKVLEIGAGNKPHYKFLKHDYDEYHIIETSDVKIDDLNQNPKVFTKNYDGKKIPFENFFFDRIIISHCLEHIYYPEEFLDETMSKLKDGGILSISLPTDPGLLFRLGRLFMRFFSIKKTYEISPIEYDYMIATEHVNSIFNLHSIIKHNYSNLAKETYLPFRIKSFDLNLFYNVHIIKSTKS